MIKNLTVVKPDLTVYNSVAQLAEAVDLGSTCCGFDSHPGYWATFLGGAIVTAEQVKIEIQKDWDNIRAELENRFGDNARALALAEVLALRMLTLGARPVAPKHKSFVR